MAAGIVLNLDISEPVIPGSETLLFSCPLSVVCFLDMKLTFT